MEEFLHSSFFHHPEVALHITLYLFDNLAPRVEVVALIQNVDTQAKYIFQMYKTCKECMH